MQRRTRSDSTSTSLKNNQSIDNARSRRKSACSTNYENVNQQYLVANNDVYPETLSAYLEELGEGIRYDLGDLWKQSIRFFFPAYSDRKALVDVPSTPDNRKIPKQDSVNTAMFIDDSDNLLSNDHIDSSISKDEQTKTMIHLRCPSTWSEKFHSSILESTNDKSDQSHTNQSKPLTDQDSSTSKRISLARLYSNKELKHYDCLDDGILILGQKKVIYVTKNRDLEGSAALRWWIPYCDLTTCMLSFQPSPDNPFVKLDLGKVSGESFSVSMNDTATCVNILQSIQERRDKYNQNGNSSANTGASTIRKTQSNASQLLTDSETDLSPTSTNRIQTLARQMQYGVSELGLKMKLENEGINDEKSRTLISRAKKLVHTMNETNKIPSSSSSQLNHRSLSSDNENIHPNQYVSSSTAILSPKKRVLPSKSKEETLGSPKKQSRISSNVDDVMNDGLDLLEGSASFNLRYQHLRKYQLMLKHGVPIGTVELKMVADKIPTDEQQYVRQHSLEVVADAVTHTASIPQTLSKSITMTNDDNTVDMTKYHLMQKHGIPIDSIVSKMKIDNVPENDRLNFSNQLNNCLRMSNEPPIHGTPSDYENNRNEIPHHLNKYFQMIKLGVPAEAVATKMQQDKVSKADQLVIVGRDIVDTMDTICTNKESIVKSKLSLSKQRHHHNSQDSEENIKLPSFHWEAIEECSDGSNIVNVRNDNIWRNIASRRESFGGVSLKEREWNEFVSMFSRRKTSQAPSSSSKGDHRNTIDCKSMESETASSQCSFKQRLSAKSVPLQVLDSKRCISLSIVVSSLRSRHLNEEKMAKAIDSVDFNTISGDDAMRLRDCLPTDGETKQLGDLASRNSLSIAALHETERYVYYISTVQRFREKVAALIFLGSWEDSLKSIAQKCDNLLAAKDIIMSSEGLSELMNLVLTIGNVMNEGRVNHNVTGFKLSSLAKLNHTKSADGATTLLDYIIQLLFSRQQSGDKASTVALAVCDELLDTVGQAKIISVHDIQKEFRMMQQEYERYQSLVQSDGAVDINVHSIASQQIHESMTQTGTKILALSNQVKEFEAYFGETNIQASEVPGQGCTSILTYLEAFMTSFKQCKQKFMDKAKRMQREESMKALKSKRISL